MSNEVTQENYYSLDPLVSGVSESVANRVALRRNQGAYGIDPMTIITIANCVIGVIRIFYACYSHDTSRALSRIQNPGFIGRVLIKREIRKHADRNMVDDILYGLTQESQTMKREDLDTILNVNKCGFFKEEE